MVLLALLKHSTNTCLSGLDLKTKDLDKNSQTLPHSRPSAQTHSPNERGTRSQLLTKLQHKVKDAMIAHVPQQKLSDVIALRATQVITADVVADAIT